ncbi:hypothetical protein FIBSPDRAFT_877801 [Athelia psychrophila]|uniref:Uncharacterized protein n=1 Tax=Athelia psychrophila TaxID=1759441 RepID=A0A167VN09_9AGAM|nr:hypothetical protein FIBSPDRAFT_877801 [Fibularhizoctonia sp. CBS 109695]
MRRAADPPTSVYRLAAAISTTDLTATKCPVVQAKVHDELDMALAGKVFTFADEALPLQLRALLLETFRV